MDALDANAGRYPVELLPQCKDALFLFGAGFQGANDAVHARYWKVRGTVVDNNPDKLAVMRDKYPDDWEFVCADAFSFLRHSWFLGVSWDLVSADPWTSMVKEMLTHLEEFAMIARKAITVTIRHQMHPHEWEVPQGWRQSRMARSANADWLILTR